MSAQELAAVVARLESVAVRLESVAAAKGQSSAPAVGRGSSSAPDAPFVKAYDEFMAGSLSQFLATSSELGGEVAEMGQLTKACFDAQRDFLVMASKSKEPSMAELPPLLAPLSQKIEAVTNYTEKHRSSKAFNNLSAVSSGIGALGWVSVKPTPGPFVKDMMDSSLFYSNKVLKEFRGVNETQVQWCKSLTGIFNELMAYIKQHHTTGVAWNPQGGVASVPSSASSTPSAGGPPPPPPPPPPPVTEDDGSAPSSGGDDGRAALFASLNKGADVTKGLKKVTDDMKTHKNPSIRQGPAPFKPNKSPSPITAPKPKATPAVAAKPPRLELEGGKKWLVEYQNGNNNIQITDTNMKQIVYIFKCNQSSVVIKGKVNSVIVDSCKKVGVVVEDVISSIEFVNCQSVKGQIMGKAPTVSIDKTDGCMVYLSKDSVEANIVTAKSSEMNILLPGADGDFKEYPVPEQFKTVWNGKELVTEATDIAG
ncbi:adenylyl cyclase-associated protein 1-like isoform X2 [Liolophura sinensis]